MNTIPKTYEQLVDEIEAAIQRKGYKRVSAQREITSKFMQFEANK